jgi:hypothetical protein
MLSRRSPLSPRTFLLVFLQVAIGCGAFSFSSHNPTTTAISATPTSSSSSSSEPPVLFEVASLRKLLREIRSENENRSVLSDDLPKELLLNECKRADLLRSRLSNRLLPLDGTMIKPSLLPDAGRGLFTTRSFSRGEIITCYPGDGVLYSPVYRNDDTKYYEEQQPLILWGTHVHNKEEASEWAVKDQAMEDYTLAVCDIFSVVGLPHHLDLDKDPAYRGHFANDGAQLMGGDESMAQYVLESNAQANAMHTNIDDCHMATVATRDIAAGEEILVTYGPDYWHESNVRNKRTFFNTMSSPVVNKSGKFKGFG